MDMERIISVCQQRGIPTHEVYPGKLHALFDDLDREVGVMSRCECSANLRFNPETMCCSQWRSIGVRLALHEYLVRHPLRQ